MLGIKALGIADRNSLAGLVRAHEAAKVTGVRLIVCVAASICNARNPASGLSDRPQGLRPFGCRLLTVGNSRAGKGACHIDWPAVAVWNEGLLAILLPDDLVNPLEDELQKLHGVFKDRAFAPSPAAFCPMSGAHAKDCQCGGQGAIPTIATNDVLCRICARAIGARCSRA